MYFTTEQSGGQRERVSHSDHPWPPLSVYQIVIKRWVTPTPFTTHALVCGAINLQSHFSELAIRRWWIELQDINRLHQHHPRRHKKSRLLVDCTTQVQERPRDNYLTLRARIPSVVSDLLVGGVREGGGSFSGGIETWYKGAVAPATARPTHTVQTKRRWGTSIKCRGHTIGEQKGGS